MKPKNSESNNSEVKNEHVVREWTEERPWGRFKNLFESAETKVKLIEVDPQKRLSYQSHKNRSEFWVVIRGLAKVVLNDRVFELKVGESIEIPKEAKHRLANETDEILQVIETQTGSYFGEDDITRYQDDWARA